MHIRFESKSPPPANHTVNPTPLGAVRTNQNGRTLSPGQKRKRSDSDAAKANDLPAGNLTFPRSAPNASSLQSPKLNGEVKVSAVIDHGTEKPLVNGHEATVNGVVHKVNGLQHKVNGLDKPLVNGHEATVGGVAHKVNGIQHKVNGLEHKKNGLEHKVNGDLNSNTNGPTRGDLRGSSTGKLSARRNELVPVRKALPIWPHQTTIRQSLQGQRDVLILAGETGSGKSTQVPQFLVREQWCGGCIAITQPRRVAAVSLARRVAEEMGTPLGSSSPASRVGYSVRFDNSTGPATKIKFLTEGMLLQEMLRDPWLKQYSCVIVDEVHERGVDLDLILGFLRKLLTGDKRGRAGRPLKVVIMSATADTEALFRFVGEGYGEKFRNKSVNGVHHSEVEEGSDSSWSGISSCANELDRNANSMAKVNGTTTHGSKKLGRRKAAVNGVVHQNGASKSLTNGVAPDRAVTQRERAQTSRSATGPTVVELSSDHISTCYIEGRQYAVDIMYLPEPTLDFVEASLKTIFQIHCNEPLPGDILVFLTGQDTVENLEALVADYALGLGPEFPKLLVLPLFAALPQVSQQRIFQAPPPRTRKVILSTNIAETSVTVPGVRFVIDCGKAKVKQFRGRLGLDSLLVKPISKSAAIQRKGRAGREAPGKCYRLYTEQEYLKLQSSKTPEILCCDLSQAVLNIKARGVDDIVNFPFLDRPPRDSLEKALFQLHQLGALDQDGHLSPVGKQIAKLPLLPAFGRVIVAAAAPEADCLVEVIDVIACLCAENVFISHNSEEKKEEAENARRDLYRREGDHLILLATIEGYAAERTDRRAWADRHFVQHRAMQNVMDIRKQLRVQCQQQKLLTSVSDEPRPHSFDTAPRILNAFLKGFAANTARLMPDGSYRSVVGNQTVAIHPSSALYGKKVEAIMYNEFVFTNRSYGRNVSAVQLDWIEAALTR